MRQELISGRYHFH